MCDKQGLIRVNAVNPISFEGLTYMDSTNQPIESQVSPQTAGQAEQPTDRTAELIQMVKKGSFSKIGLDLAKLAVQDQPGMPPPGGIRVANGKVKIEAAASQNVQILMSDLQKLGISDTVSSGTMVAGILPVAQIRNLSSLESLQFARAVTFSDTRSSSQNPLNTMATSAAPSSPNQLSQNNPAQSDQATATNATNQGSVISQGDAAMQADIARQQFGVDGTGVKVGVIASSFNVLGSDQAKSLLGGIVGSDNPALANLGADQSIASGDLPRNIEVLREPQFEASIVLDQLLGQLPDEQKNQLKNLPPEKLQQQLSRFTGPVDEGRAMMELIHDVAPGADLAFHTGASRVELAEGIRNLATAGSNVIVDDIGFSSEPFFQDGIVAQAANEAAAKGISYFSSSGNNERDAYDSAFNPSGQKDAMTGGELHDFDPGPGVDTLQSFTLDKGNSVALAFQWDQPFFSASGQKGASSDLDLVIYDQSGKVVAMGVDNNIGGDASELIRFQNDETVEGNQFNLAIVNNGGPNPGLMKYVPSPSGSITVNEFKTGGSTSVGHPNAANTAGVGAAGFNQTPKFGVNPPVAESFTSEGGTPILFDAQGNRLPTPEFRPQPRFTAPDDVNTTFFGSLESAGAKADGDQFPNFAGTSAAAPHAAGVAALMKQLNPNASPDEIYQALSNSAIDMGKPGFDNITGAGLIQADKAVGAIAKPVTDQFDAQYNLLSALLGAYSDPDTRPLAEQLFDQLGYVIDRVFEDPTYNFTAAGLRSKDGSQPPVLVLPGGIPGNPISVGNAEFTANGNALRDWLVAIAGDSQKNPQGLKPDVTGASRGGALTQLVASAFPTLIGSGVSFKSPGVNAEATDDFLSNGGDPSQIRHYITSGDFRSLYGEAFLPGTVTMSTDKSPGSLDQNLSTEQQLRESYERKHSSGILADFSSLLPDTSNPIIAGARAITDKPAGLTLSQISVDDLNRPDFTFQDEDWQMSRKQAQTQTNNPNLRFFETREGQEELRKHFGAGDDFRYLGEVGKNNLGGPGNVNNLFYPGIAGLDPIPTEQINQPTGGNDVIFGTTCDKSISGLDGDDYIRGGDSNDTLFGNEGDDVLIGNRGDDILSGGAGFNILTGGEGHDLFFFDTVFVSEAKVGDRSTRINDFTPGEDMIGLSKTMFTRLTNDLTGAFGTFTDDAAAAASQALLVYNTSKGSLTYNANGAEAGFGDAGGPIALVFGQPTLTAHDFKLV
jgi:Subtilase family/RTX calcium-binding nonapeptide repeat (4 copies)